MSDKTKSKGPSIQWEDDDDSFGREKELEDAGGRDEFAALMDTDAEPDKGFVTVGERTQGRVTAISTTSNDVLVDLGGKLAGVIDRNELLDESGQLTVKVGDVIEAFVLARKGVEVQLSYKMSQALRSIDDIEAAYNRKIPVRGRVAKLGKGGFEVTVLGKPAFCPISQIDARFVENGQEYVGLELEFLIEKFESRGRNIVLSRAALLRQQAEVRLKELMASLKPDTVLDGTVKEVRDFGAFVDIGGVEGLVHVSELSHARVARAQDAVRKGEKVRVKVLKIEGDAGPGGKPKISLSIKAALQDPWDEVEQHVEGGKTYTGRVVSLQAFGAFVEIKPGFEGLVHVSEMSWTKRVHHPSEVLKVGDAVTVSVKDVDRAHKRISLTMKQVEDDPWFEATARFPAGKVVTAPVDKLKSFGALVELAPGLSGLVPVSVLKRKFGEAYRQAATPGKPLEVKVLNVDATNHKLQLTLTGIEEDADANEDYQEYLRSEQAAKAAAAQQQQQATGGGSGGAARPGSLGALLQAKLEQKKGG